MKILALGSNLPFGSNTPKQNLECVYDLLELEGIKILKKSKIYFSEAYPNKLDPLFCNSAIFIETNLKPFDLLNIVLKIEKKFGRERKVKNSPRTLDIDIICYDNLILNDENLQIPHPNIQDRLFVLMPICDLNENWKHPIHSKTALEFIKSFSEEQINKLKKA